MKWGQQALKQKKIKSVNYLNISKTIISLLRKNILFCRASDSADKKSCRIRAGI